MKNNLEQNQQLHTPDEDIVEALSQHAREVLVVDGVEEL